MVVAYRWIQNDERRSKIHINKKCGMIVFEINAKICQTGPTEWHFTYVPLFRKLLVRTWCCRIPLDTEWCETSDKTLFYITRIWDSWKKSEHCSHGGHILGDDVTKHNPNAISQTSDLIIWLSHIVGFKMMRGGRKCTLIRNSVWLFSK